MEDYDVVYWVAQKVDLDYADPEMAIIWVPTAGAEDDDAMNTEWTDAEAYWDTLIVDNKYGYKNCNETKAWGIITPTTKSCFNLIFDASHFESLYKLNVTDIDGLAIYAQHFPTEFESTTHYLIAPDGTPIEPLVETELSTDDDDDEPKKVRRHYS